MDEKFNIQINILLVKCSNDFKWMLTAESSPTCVEKLQELFEHVCEENIKLIIEYKYGEKLNHYHDNKREIIHQYLIKKVLI